MVFLESRMVSMVTEDSYRPLELHRMFSAAPLREQLLPAPDGTFFGEGYLMAPGRTPADLRQLLLDSSQKFPFVAQLFLKNVTDYVIAVHGKDLRKDGRTLYSNHPLRVALHLDTPLKRAVALLHDVQEDKGITNDDLYQYLSKHGYHRDLANWLFVGVDAVSTKTIVFENGQMQLMRRVPKHQEKAPILEKEEEYYKWMFKIDKENPQLGIAELKLFDRRDNILSDIIVILNSTRSEEQEIRTNAIERLRSVLSKSKPFSKALKRYRGDLFHLFTPVMRLGGEVLREATIHHGPK